MARRRTALAAAGLLLVLLLLRRGGDAPGRTRSRPLFVLVLTAPSAAEQRATARGTWLAGGKATHRFAVCGGGVDAAARGVLEEEGRVHGDVLWLHGCEEGFGALAAKLGAALLAVHEGFEGYRAVLKADDDTYVRLDGVAGELAARPDAEMLYWGYFDGRAEVRRRGKYRELEWNLCDTYLPYAVGGGYVVGRRLVAHVAAGWRGVGLRRFGAEDASLGLWLAAAEATRWHDVRFDTEWKSRGCEDGYLVLHKRSPEQMRSIHARLAAGLGPCERPGLVRVQYEYNWAAKASECCPGRGRH